MTRDKVMMPGLRLLVQTPPMSSLPRIRDANLTEARWKRPQLMPQEICHAIENGAGPSGPVDCGIEACANAGFSLLMGERQVTYLLGSVADQSVRVVWIWVGSNGC